MELLRHAGYSSMVVAVIAVVVTDYYMEYT
jgi:hypothetical protein